MPRKATATWLPRRRVWVAALGERYEVPVPGTDRTRTRRRQVVLCDLHGIPIGRHDESGRLAALGRLTAACAAEDAGAVDPPLAVVLRMWADWHAGRGCSPRSDEGRRGRITRVANIPWRGGGLLGDVPISTIGDDHFHAIRAHGERLGWASGYIRGHCADFLAGVRWAARSIYGREPSRLIRTNPFPEKSVELPKMGRSDRPCPDWGELLAILDRLDARVERADRRGMRSHKAREAARVLALEVRVIAERGCRPAEVVGLRVEDWDDAKSGFRLDAHKTSGKTGVGVIALRPATAVRVRALINRPDRVGPWVFGPLRAGSQGPPCLKALRAWWAAQKGHVGAGNYQLYSFRNTLSNHLRAKGVAGRGLQLALRQGDEVADTVYRRDRIDEASAIFEAAGLG